MTAQRPLVLVLGIRPDVIRASLMIQRLSQELGDRFVFVWSGQHYSDNLKDVFFRQLDVPSPSFELGITGGTDTEFIGKWVRGLGQLLETIDPVGCAFLGDTNTVLGTLACASLNIPIAHIEGCMRSYDWRMPEEKYRTVADHLSDVIYAYFDEYKQQGLLEGLDARQIVVTGNPIVDVLEHYFLSGRIRLNDGDRSSFFSSLGLDPTSDFAVMTSHRRENVEDETALRRIIGLAGATSMPVVFPASYRTQKSLARFGISIPANVRVIDPIGYVELLELIVSSQAVLTDSGTVVEETAVLGVPSVQMRSSTERPQVYDSGSSVKFDPHVDLSSSDMAGVFASAVARRSHPWSHGLGDGKASHRIVDDLLARVANPSSFRGHEPSGNSRPVHRNGGLGIGDLGDWHRSIGAN
jgi:UDP-N-acetylglucosamine 2-epimerase